MSSASLSCSCRTRGGAAVRWFAFPVFPRDMRALAALSAIAVIGFAHGWGHTMDVTGSGLDYYPSRWLSSIGFRGTVIAGTLAGSFLWASLFPWRPVRIAAAFLLVAAILALFFGSLKTGIWFEMYMGREFPSALSYHVVHGAVLTAILGWLLALVVLAKRVVVTAAVGVVSAVRAVLR